MISRAGPVCLVVDADSESLAATMGMLRAGELTVFGARSAVDAVEYGRSIDFDVILSELDVAGVPGGDIVEEVRCIPWQAEVPVLYCSGFQRPEIICRRAIDELVYQLRKPIDPRLLLELAEQCRQWKQSRSRVIVEPNRAAPRRAETPLTVAAPHLGAFRQVVAEMVTVRGVPDSRLVESSWAF